MTRIGLLVCGHVHAEAREIGGDYPELFTTMLAPFDVDVVSFDATEGALPTSVDECAGWLTSPSRSSVIDGDPWISELAAFIRAAVEAEQPFAGMCFGHQLLATTFGGAVERSPNGWGAGAKTFEVVTTRPWMDPPLDRFRLIASHEDQVTRLPDGAHLLASADYCPIAAFELGSRAIGIQPHPEFTAPLSRRLCELRVELMGAEVTDAALRSLDQPLDRDAVARWVATFLGVARPA